MTRRVLAGLMLFLRIASAFAGRVQLGGLEDLSVDFPEGIEVLDANEDGTACHLRSMAAPVEAIIRIYGGERYRSAKEALDASLGALSFSSESEEADWRNQKCAVATFTGKLDRKSIAGFGIAAPLPGGKGAVVMLDWCAQKQLELCTPFMASLLDSLNIDAGSYFEPGPITAYLYPRNGADIPVTLSINGRTVATALQASDREASEYLVEREYAVLTLYAQSSLWLPAWQRYYRMIFRDSYKRLQRAAFDVYNAVAPDCADDTDLAQKLLTWTQGLIYEREQNSSDFTALPSILLGGGSDCDSRSLLLAVLLTAMNQDAILLVSPAYSHAMAAITSDHPGHSFSYGGQEYLMGDTTLTGGTWGIIAADMDDQGKWFEVMFP